MSLNYREAVKLIRRNGGRFVWHGARHDLFETKDGKEIQVPRHAKDLSSGVERDIKEKLGMR